MARGRNAALTYTCPVPRRNRSVRYWRAGIQQHREGVAGLWICKSVSGSAGRARLGSSQSYMFAF